MTHHCKFRVEAGINTELEPAGAATWSSGIAHGLFWDPTVAGKDGGGEDHVRE